MTIVDVALGALGLAFLAAIVRVTIGPTDADRAVGADLAFFVLIAAVALLAVRLDEPAFFDVTLVATLVGFVASVALARLVDRERP